MEEQLRFTTICVSVHLGPCLRVITLKLSVFLLTFIKSFFRGGVMKKVLFFVAPKGFRDEELFETREVFEGAGFGCSVASFTTGACAGMLGGSVKPDYALADVDLEQFSCLIMVGGSGVVAIYEESALLELFDDAYRKGLFVGAICLGPMVLARTDILKGKRATVFKTDASIQLFRDHGCAYQPDDLVVDGRVITASGPHVSKAFGRKLVELLDGS